MAQILKWKNQQYRITTDNTELDIIGIHQYLTRSSWSEGIDIDTVRQAIANSLNFGLFDQNEQIGFARIVTDFSTFGYLCDVYVLEEYQKQKLGRWLMECCHSHPALAQLRRIMLVTSTAPWLYEKMGYTPVNRENFVWNIVRQDIYKHKV
ncbi:GNAT family N-acetyltransferase [Xenorhabdus bovienii]|uniref:GCN5-related N-acetyltransferase n=1 Tax=Xenorhabdus bovienii str. feltiae Moldova TaxID=1398200 RepID=A0A077NSL3_XENBV|nr:GNAT family N-acetyltransferase [Xenorhabdus bovienii]CDH01564.1 GCN5-related N-acetyltransferase [Xenorhabdus bovienii str. feltiae Moldova]